MTRVVEAIYEDGMLKPLQDPELEEHQRVLLMIRGEPQEGSQTTLEDWQRVYEGLSDEEIAAIEALRESLASDSFQRIIGKARDEVREGKTLSLEEMVWHHDDRP